MKSANRISQREVLMRHRIVCWLYNKYGSEGDANTRGYVNRLIIEEGIITVMWRALKVER